MTVESPLLVAAARTLRLLPETLVNRIAAGEVIERPAVAVKELVENALDSGAGRIAVSLTGGGIARIEVTDDGCGMSAADLALAVQRHATSKLTDDTLVRIATLGFRGEALPSIGAAARLAITSRPRHADSAATIRVEGGAVAEVQPAPGAPGTRVVVTDLFFATPARRKFLKQPRSEADQAELAVRRLAIAAPHVAFRLETEGRVVFDLPPQDDTARIAALFGPEAADALIRVEAERGPLRLHGFTGSPAYTRATAGWQYLMVNGRPVTDTVLKTALRVAYRDVIEYGRHPVAALNVTIPADDIDVNVHPAKTEVRFRDAAAVRALVIGGIGRTLAGGAGAVSLPVQFTPPARSRGFARPVYPANPAPPYPAAHPHAPPPGWNAAARPGFAEAPTPYASSGLDLGTPTARMLADSAPEAPPIAYPLGAPVAQVLDTYVIAVAADGSLVLVDQHAAHERLTHEAIRDQMLQGGARSQPLLMPAVIDLPPADAARLAAHAGTLAKLGLELEGFGLGAILVRALPAALGAPDPAPLLRDLADELAESGEATALDAKLDAVIARMACHGSIRAGRRLNASEMGALLRQMEATPRAATCSHGRPTFLKLSKAEIEKLFGRR